MNRILVVCAHPDDETLGLGGTIKSHTVKKDSVFVLCFSHGQFDRDESEIGITRREEQARSAFKILGVKKVFWEHHGLFCASRLVARFLK